MPKLAPQRLVALVSIASKVLDAGSWLKSTETSGPVDRPGLEARTGEYYAVVKKESDRLLPPPVLQ